MRIINLLKPKTNKTMKNFNFLPYISLYWLDDKRTFCIGWLNICFVWGYWGIVNES